MHLSLRAPLTACAFHCIHLLRAPLTVCTSHCMHFSLHAPLTACTSHCMRLSLHTSHCMRLSLHTSPACTCHCMHLSLRAPLTVCTSCPLPAHCAEQALGCNVVLFSPFAPPRHQLACQGNRNPGLLEACATHGKQGQRACQEEQMQLRSRAQGGQGRGLSHSRVASTDPCSAAQERQEGELGLRVPRAPPLCCSGWCCRCPPDPSCQV